MVQQHTARALGATCLRTCWVGGEGGVLAWVDCTHNDPALLPVPCLVYLLARRGHSYTVDKHNARLCTNYAYFGYCGLGLGVNAARRGGACVHMHQQSWQRAVMFILCAVYSVPACGRTTIVPLMALHICWMAIELHACGEHMHMCHRVGCPVKACYAITPAFSATHCLTIGVLRTVQFA